ncbi:hypothetical protein C463_10605 [Halorubrum californiense DSM 19288]|uniref:Uncharacterized protein n=1 Tax=Halorubrum californiense DSM 19288 TaxID=1227465 RepID=M0E8D8_9EURY|nr:MULTISPECIES: hypothetical protein [Halorubrum]ELZ42639.1 hypothetical protein C463_10605 [Halorubrum californiense DSM 19288]TKX71222.1 hypothetical protein EXE40_08310 [Halorubrum sp. GN11GM_10-3_MGM]
MSQYRELPCERHALAVDVEAVVESDTDTLVGAVSRGEFAGPELELLCREADAETIGIDDGVLEVVRIVTALLAHHDERSDETDP